MKEMPMHLAYLTTYDSLDVTRWSGTGFYISKALEDQGIELTRIGNFRSPHNPINVSRYLWNKYLRGLNDHPHRDPGFLRNYAMQASNQLERSRSSGTRIDAIFTPGILPIAYLDTDLPIVVWTDCTFAGLLNYYPAWTNMSRRSIRDGHEADRLGLRRADLLIFTSDWAARSAVDDYGCDPERVKVVPLGANVSDTRTSQDIRALAETRLTSKPIKLLLPGVSWHRKGCDFAVRVTACLNELGCPSELDIIGCHPPAGVRLPDFVKSHGFISKSSPAGREFIEQKFSDATFLLLPTIAECTAVVFNEAASFGLPSFTTDTGGTPSIVRNGRNGFTFPVRSDPAHWAQEMAALLNDPVRYLGLCESAFAEFRSRLNWGSAGAEVAQLLRDRHWSPNSAAIGSA
jgi:glycosyltransferase involved in cell wall biosynthesis